MLRLTRACLRLAQYADPALNAHLAIARAVLEEKRK